MHWVSTSMPLFLSSYEKKLIAEGNKHPLALENPADTAVEAIRSLRTSVFSVMNQGNNLVMVTSASPGVGKALLPPIWR